MLLHFRAMPAEGPSPLSSERDVARRKSARRLGGMVEHGKGKKGGKKSAKSKTAKRSKAGTPPSQPDLGGPSTPVTPPTDTTATLSPEPSAHTGRTRRWRSSTSRRRKDSANSAAQAESPSIGAEHVELTWPTGSRRTLLPWQNAADSLNGSPMMPRLQVLTEDYLPVSLSIGLNGGISMPFVISVVYNNK